MKAEAFVKNQRVFCWCGHSGLQPFSTNYGLCPKCQSLVLTNKPRGNIEHVTDKNTDLYGKEYYLSRQSQLYGYPEITSRARTDIPERCLYWLRTLLKFKLPPAKVLELGSGHGGFVAILRLAGFDAIGLELSPWVVNFARNHFSIPMLLGPIQDQSLEEGSLDIIALMDVLEHLTDPLSTIRHCLKLLKPEGILLIQTPSFPENNSYEEMVKEHPSFLEHLKEEEHIYLFSRYSIQKFFNHLGIENILFEPPIFAHYDMFLVASRTVLVESLQEDIVEALSATPGGRMTQALLDLYEQNKELIVRLRASETDRTARLDQINELTRLLKDSDIDRAARLEQMNELTRLLNDSEADRAARLEVINNLDARLKQSETDREKIERDLDKLNEELKNIKSKRAYRFLKTVKLLP